MGKEHQMKRNGTEYIEIGLGGHSRITREERGGGAASVNLACDNFFQKQGMGKKDFVTFQQPTNKKTK
jgi:hypothetical protein